MSGSPWRHRYISVLVWGLRSAGLGCNCFLTIALTPKFDGGDIVIIDLASKHPISFLIQQALGLVLPHELALPAKQVVRVLVQQLAE